MTLSTILIVPPAQAETTRTRQCMHYSLRIFGPLRLWRRWQLLSHMLPASEAIRYCCPEIKIRFWLDRSLNIEDAAFAQDLAIHARSHPFRRCVGSSASRGRVQAREPVDAEIPSFERTVGLLVVGARRWTPSVGAAPTPSATAKPPARPANHAALITTPGTCSAR